MCVSTNSLYLDPNYKTNEWPLKSELISSVEYDTKHFANFTQIYI